MKETDIQKLMNEISEKAFIRTSTFGIKYGEPVIRISILKQILKKYLWR